MKTLRRILFALAVGIVISTALVWANDTALYIPVRILGIVAISAIGLALVTGIAETRSWQMPPAEDAPVSKPVMPKSPVEKAMEAMDNAQATSTRTAHKVRIRIDTEDARHNDK